MARVDVTIVLLTNRFSELADELQEEADAISLETAQQIMEEYRRAAREDTGAQKSSAYIATPEESGYSEAVAAAKGKNPEAEMLSEVETPEAHTVVIAVAAAYAFGNEYGRHGMAGDGALTQAVESQRQAYRDEINRLIERTAGE